MGETLHGVDYMTMPPKELAGRAKQVWSQFERDISGNVKTQMPPIFDEFEALFPALIAKVQEYGDTS